MSHYGQVKKFLPFRAMSKQCEFSTLQGVSNQVTHQTHPSTADNDRHHPNTYYTSSRHHSDMSIHLLTSTETNWHKQTPTDTPRHSQTQSHVGWCWLKVTFWRLMSSWCLLACVGVFCCLEISWWCLGSCVGVYERCLWISKVFACVWGVI